MGRWIPIRIANGFLFSCTFANIVVDSKLLSVAACRFCFGENQKDCNGTFNKFDK